MSHYGKYMLWAAIAVEIAYVGFFMAMTDGLSLGDRSPMFMGLSVLGFLIAVAIVIILQQWLITPAPHAVPDERQEMVDIKSEQAGGRFLDAGVFVVIALAIYEASAGPNTLGSYSITRPEALVFAMITITSLASVFRMILAVVRDQRP